ncbi:YSIRK-type signal peptide-containing protein [Streptococcus ruminantium]|uniref:YSIRK-type signal peptide-containing protein n=1 Tax=Streptococcus ruminantium TaxID=1917441 RepID=UPI001F3A3453|nr:YSIRK-type signal peptide-containing protein [Streptococcus ruminantium]BDD39927.1 hypothetical protein GUT184_01910 [Streptococcus ruminantium]
MDKSKKKQRYSLRKTQMGVGSVLLATVLLTAGTAKADSVVGPGGGFGLTGGIQGNSDPNISSIGQGGGEHQKQGPGLGLGLNKDGKTQISSLAGPSGSGHGGNHLGLTLGLGGGAYIYGNGEHSEVEEPKLHVPEKGRTPEPDKKPEVDQETLEETPKPQPRVAPQPAPKTEETPKKEKDIEKEKYTYWLVYQEGLSEKAKDPSSSRIGTELGREGYNNRNEKDSRIAAAKKKYTDKGYHPDYDRFDYGDSTLLVFHRFKTFIVLRTIGNDGKVDSEQTSVFYGDKRQEDVKNRVDDLTKKLGEFYNVEYSEKNDKEREKTIILTLKPKTNEADKPAPDMPKVPEVPKNPEKPSVPSTPEVAPQPDKPSVPSTPEVAPQPEKPSVPSKPEVAPKPGDKPSVPSIPEMVPEPEKLEMDKSMKVVPGKPKKATPEAQVPEAQVPQVPQVQVPQSQAPQLPSPKEEVAKVQQQPRAIQSSAPAKSGGKQLPNTGEAASILTLVGSGMLGLLGLAFTKKRKTK